MMKPIPPFSLLLILCFLVVISCKNKSAEENIATTEPAPDTVRYTPVSRVGAVPFTVTGGTVFWSARKALGIVHNGTIAISGGELLVNDGQLHSGKVNFDMTTIGVTNVDDPRDEATLVSHLKDKDFFDVKKYPEASFEITEIQPSSQPAFNWVIRGTLTIKDKSHPVNVPVRMYITVDGLQAESVSFLINRTKWGVNFRSGLLCTAKDQIIEDGVTVSFKLEAQEKPAAADPG